MKNNNSEQYDPVISRLDAIIKLLLLKEFSDEKKNLKLGDTAKFLYKCGWGPSEIAKFLGKKKASDINYILYSKKK